MSYIPVHLNTLRGDDPVNFDVYIRLGERYVHYLRKSDPFDADRIENLRRKRVKKLFIPEAEEPAYLAYLDSGLDKAKDERLSIESRGEHVSGALQTEAENAARNVQTEQGYKHTEARVGKIVDFLTSQSSALKSVLTSAGCAQDVFQHSANVVSLSLGLAAAMELKDPRIQLELGMAALLHDIGLGRLGLEPQAEVAKLPADVREKYYQHPKEAASMLADKPYVTPGVLELIQNHEECGAGAGYPEKKRLANLPLPQQILNLCNAYDRYCTTKGISPIEGMNDFFQSRIGHFELQHLKLLVSTLK